MQKKFYIIMLILPLLILTGCGETSQSNANKITKQIVAEEKIEKTLNNLMLVFEDRMEKYLGSGKKDLKELEKLHLDFVPILGWKKFKGDDNYNKAALSVGSIVHRLEDLDEAEYDQLLSKLKPAYIKFHTEFGE